MPLMEFLTRWLRRARKPAPLPLGPQAAGQLAAQLDATREDEYSCDDVLVLLDQFTEAVMRGDDVTRLMPLVHRHLEMCPDCREEFEALLRILKTSPAA